MAKIGVISDSHGGTTGGTPQDIALFSSECGLSAILQPGDFGQYNSVFPIPVYWTYGNREDKQIVTSGKVCFAENNTLLLDYQVVDVCGLRVVAIGGAERPKGDGYIIVRDIDELSAKCSGLYGKVDVLITHETPIHKVETAIGGHVCDTESPAIRAAVKIMQPKLAFSGHWHINMQETIGVTDCYCMGLDPARDWLVLDTETLEVLPRYLANIKR